MNRPPPIDQAKARLAYAARRASAIQSHGWRVVATGLDTTKALAALALRDVKSLAREQKAILADGRLSLRERIRQVRSHGLDAAVALRRSWTTAAAEGLDAVRDRLSHVTDITHAEQAAENRLARKAKKARRMARRQ